MKEKKQQKIKHSLFVLHEFTKTQDILYIEKTKKTQDNE